jgi:hypothetical protein
VKLGAKRRQLLAMAPVRFSYGSAELCTGQKEGGKLCVYKQSAISVCYPNMVPPPPRNKAIKDDGQGQDGGGGR